MVAVNSHTEEDRRSASTEKLATLVQTRTATLSKYTSLAGQRPFSEQADLSNVLREFCETLIDYTASAHFQLYRYIAEKMERRTAVREIASQVYPHIIKTTDTILNFNDKYENIMSCNKRNELCKTLDEDLSHLGEALAERIHFEDQVISAIAGEVVH
ncbi:MAG: Rsd/AlgQ family anti-sigma factor [Gammaproteobacteria bacterium]